MNGECSNCKHWKSHQGALGHCGNEANYEASVRDLVKTGHMVNLIATLDKAVCSLHEARKVSYG